MSDTKLFAMKPAAAYFTHIAPLLTSGYAIVTGHMIHQGNSPTFTRVSRLCDPDNWGLICDIPEDIIYDLMVTESSDGSGKSVIYLLGRQGLLRILQSGKQPQDLPVLLKEPWAYLESLCVTRTSVYVCGGQNQIYCLQNGVWQSCDDGLYAPFTGQNDMALFGIGELLNGAIMVVGKHGLIAIQHAQQPWQRLNIEHPACGDFLSVLASGDGGAWIGGTHGVLLKYKPDGHYDDLSNPSLSTDRFESLALYQGKLYIAACHQLLCFSETEGLSSVDIPIDSSHEYHCVRTQGNYLWVTGSTAVLRLGPEGWKRFICPDNI